MSKDRDLIFDMTEDPEVLTYPAADNEPLQLGGVGDDAAAAADRQVTTPGDVRVAPQMPAPIDGTLRQFALRVPSVIDECTVIMRKDILDECGIDVSSITDYKDLTDVYATVKEKYPDMVMMASNNSATPDTKYEMNDTLTDGFGVLMDHGQDTLVC